MVNLKKIILSAGMALFVACAAIAGELVEINCDRCAYKSEALYEGSSGSGVAKGIVYCDACKQFYSLSIKNYTDDTTNIVKPLGKKEFLGKVRITYPCPKCGSEAYLYYAQVSAPGGNNPLPKEELCPRCKKGKLHKQMIGKWD